MLYDLLSPYAADNLFCNLFRYLTFRTGGATLTAFFLTLWIGPFCIRWFRKIQGKGQPIRSDGPASHLVTKVGTPTMGGAIMLCTLTLSLILWGDLSNPYVVITLISTLGLGALGWMDDYLKVKQQNVRGVIARYKLLGQIVISAGVGVALMHYLPEGMQHHIAIPFFKNVLIPLHAFYILFVMLVVMGSSNAVNLTDGLDGLAIGPVIVATACFAVIAYLSGNAVFASYLQLHYVPGAGELAVFCGALLGAGLGFLWFNAPPAMIFMGDMGSMAIGGALGTLSLITKHELVWFVMGGLFVMETVSVILQVLYFKLTGGKRIFLMAPLHHHFEKKGWSETAIVIRFWIISFVLALIALSTLKLR